MSGWCKACGRQAHAENREARRAQQREYYKANREAFLDRAHRHYRTNRDSVRAYRREWAKQNSDKTRRYAREYVARKRAAGPLDDAASAYWDILADDPCSYCGGPAGEVDHIVALNNSGTNDWTNLTAACRSCNASKSTKSPLDFLLA